MAEKVVSPRFSLKGWNFKEWFVGNWSTIKEVAKLGAPMFVSMLLMNNPFLIGLFTLIGKFLLDMGEYFVKEYKA